MMNRRAFLRKTVSAAAASTFLPGLFGARYPVIHPPRLRGGGTVGIVSPAGITYDPHQLNIFVESIQAMGLETRVGEHALSRWGYLAGEDEKRAEEINRMFRDPDIDAIFALAGGWGGARLLDRIDYTLVRDNPKIFMGFSDITSLLVGIYARSGLVTFHGPTGNSTWNAFTAEYVKRVLINAEAVLFENPTEKGDNLTQTENRIWTIRPGTARGRLVGGNLTVLSSIIGSRYLPDWDGHILFLEDVGEDIYRIDRMLTQLRLAGVFELITGFIFGRCSRCEPDSTYSSFTLAEVLSQHVEPLGIPAFHGSMIGHVRDKFTVPIGVPAQIDADLGTIQLRNPAVT